MDKKKIDTAGLQRFDEAPGRPRLRYFYTTPQGKFSKRAFFFSLFAFIALAYIILGMIDITRFDEGLSWFILGCNGAFGLNYYANEKERGRGYVHSKQMRKNSNNGFFEQE